MLDEGTESESAYAVDQDLPPEESGDGSPRPVRVLIAGGQQISCAGLKAILQGSRGVGTVRLATSPRVVDRQLAADGADVLVIDDSGSPAGEVLNLIRRLAATHGTGLPGVIVVVDIGEGDRLLEYLHAGVRGLVSRDDGPLRVVEAVRAVADGAALLSPSITRYLIESVIRYLPAAVGQPNIRLGKLTRRELEIFGLLSDGLSNAEIAEALQLSYKTVKFHVSNILHKLSVRSRVEAIVHLRSITAAAS